MMYMSSARLNHAACGRPASLPRCKSRCVHHTASLTAGLVVENLPRHRCIAASAEQDEAKDAVNYNKEFGYSRKDVVLIGVGLIALGYGLYYGIQAAGVDPLMAGNITQLVIIVGLCVLWIGSYVFRVMNKDMTYVRQLKEYEDAVMAKRLEEMTDEEVQKMIDNAEAQKRPPEAPKRS